MFGELQVDFASAYLDATARMSADEHALFQSTTEADLSLGNACLEVEHELRRREWDALEVLLAAIPPGGDLESIYELPAAQALPALRRRRYAAGCERRQRSRERAGTAKAGA